MPDSTQPACGLAVSAGAELWVYPAEASCTRRPFSGAVHPSVSVRGRGTAGQAGAPVLLAEHPRHWMVLGRPSGMREKGPVGTRDFV